MRRSYPVDSGSSLVPRDLFDTLVYGPVSSRRLGRSLGINPLPPDVKLCSFNCPYCQFGWTGLHVGAAEEAPSGAFPSVKAVGLALEEALTKLAQEGTKIDCLTFAGNGEPTLHPGFAELVEVASGLRDRLMPEARLSVLTNGSTLHLPRVAEALNLLDERVVKLDAGDWNFMRAVNLPHRSFDFDRMVASLPNLVDCVIQSMFVRGRVDNTTEEVVASWIALVARIAPLAVQVYSLDRVPADGSLEVVPEDDLREIALRCESATGVPCEVY